MAQERAPFTVSVQMAKLPKWALGGHGNPSALSKWGKGMCEWQREEVRQRWETDENTKSVFSALWRVRHKLSRKS